VNRAGQTIWLTVRLDHVRASAQLTDPSPDGSDRGDISDDIHTAS
jgi:hypothetical protein